MISTLILNSSRSERFLRFPTINPRESPQTTITRDYDARYRLFLSTTSYFEHFSRLRNHIFHNHLYSQFQSQIYLPVTQHISAQHTHLNAASSSTSPHHPSTFVPNLTHNQTSHQKHPMYQSNFQKLLQSNPNISSKPKSQQTPKPQDPKLIDTAHGQYKRIEKSKITSVSNKVNQTQLEQLAALGKYSGFSKATEAKKTDETTRVDRKAAPKIAQAPTKQVKEEPTHVKKFLNEADFKQLTRQQKQIQEFKAEWFLTTKQRILLPPLHDPIVLMHHYGLGQLQESVFHDSELENQDLVESDYKHILLRVVAVTKFGQVVYDHLVAPSEKVTNYRSEITGITANNFRQNYDSRNSKSKGQIYVDPQVKTLEQVRRDIAEIVDQRVLVGYGLTTCPALQAVLQELMIARFSTYSRRKNLNPQQEKEFIQDLQLDRKLRSSQYLLELLLISHPTHLLRDFLHGQILPLKELVIKTRLQTATEFVAYQDTLLQDPALQQRLQKPQSEYQQSKNKDRGAVKRDNFLTLSRPLDFASLDTLLNQSMSLIQFYFIYKILWDQHIKKQFGPQISAYHVKLVELTKMIEKRREIEAIKEEQEREKQLRRDRWAERRGNTQTKPTKTDAVDSDDDSDSNNTDSSSSRWASKHDHSDSDDDDDDDDSTDFSDSD